METFVFEGEDRTDDRRKPPAIVVRARVDRSVAEWPTCSMEEERTTSRNERERAKSAEQTKG